MDNKEKMRKQKDQSLKIPFLESHTDPNNRSLSLASIGWTVCLGIRVQTDTVWKIGPRLKNISEQQTIIVEYQTILCLFYNFTVTLLRFSSDICSIQWVKSFIWRPTVSLQRRLDTHMHHDHTAHCL